MGHLTLEDYQIWSVKSALANEFLNLLFQVSAACATTLKPVTGDALTTFLSIFLLIQVCHIVLGLRPGTPEEEGQIIRSVALHSIYYLLHTSSSRARSS